jgi:hypothetical protein
MVSDRKKDAAAGHSVGSVQQQVRSYRWKIDDALCVTYNLISICRTDTHLSHFLDGITAK